MAEKKVLVNFKFFGVLRILAHKHLGGPHSQLPLNSPAQQVHAYSTHAWLVEHIR